MKAAEVLERRAALKKRLTDILNAEVGKDLLADLEEAFDPDDMRGDKVEDTYFNLGARSVVRYLKSLRDEGKKSTT